MKKKPIIEIDNKELRKYRHPQNNLEYISTTKKPTHEAEPTNSYKLCPSWRFYCMDISGKWSPIDNGLFNDLSVLTNYENRTWAEIFGEKSHMVNVCNLIKKAQNRLSELHLYYDQLISLRITGKKRIYCIFDNGVALIIWYDLNHEIYPCPKKHT